MLFRQHKLIFLHQRKCAGLTAHRILGPISQEDKGLYQDGPLSREWKEDEVRPFLKVAIVRNPWDRFVSGWKYLAGTRDVALADLLARLPPVGKPFRHLTRQQTATLRYPDGRWAVDMLISFETLQEDFNLLFDLLGAPRRPLPHVNPTRERKPYVEVFGKSERDLFQAAFATDLAILGYTFDKPGKPGLRFAPPLPLRLKLK